jgi:hypothetical protein
MPTMELWRRGGGNQGFTVFNIKIWSIQGHSRSKLGPEYRVDMEVRRIEGDRKGYNIGLL